MAYELPYQIHETLEQVRDGQIEVGFVHKGVGGAAGEVSSCLSGPICSCRRARSLVLAVVVPGCEQLLGDREPASPNCFFGYYTPAR